MKKLEKRGNGKVMGYHWHRAHGYYLQANRSRSGPDVVDDDFADCVVNRSDLLGQAAGTGSQHRPSESVG